MEYGEVLVPVQAAQIRNHSAESITGTLMSTGKGLRAVRWGALTVFVLLLAAACATRGPTETQATEEQGLAAGAKAERSGDLENALVEYVTVLTDFPKSA